MKVSACVNHTPDSAVHARARARVNAFLRQKITRRQSDSNSSLVEGGGRIGFCTLPIQSFNLSRPRSLRPSFLGQERIYGWVRAPRLEFVFNSLRRLKNFNVPAKRRPTNESLHSLFNRFSGFAYARSFKARRFMGRTVV